MKKVVANVLTRELEETSEDTICDWTPPTTEEQWDKVKQSLSKVEELRYCFHVSMFLSLYFVPFIALFSVLLLFAGVVPVWVVIIIAIACVVDAIVPLNENPAINDIVGPLCKDWVLHSRKYHPARVVFHPELEKDKNYLFSGHPHGLFFNPFGMINGYLYKKYGICMTFTGASVVKYLPLLRRYMRWWGFVEATPNGVMKACQLPYPHNVCFSTTGGINEMFYDVNEDMECQVIVERRKGFVKYCLKTGTQIVPVYGFGNGYMYNRKCDINSTAAKISNVINTSILWWTGRWYVPFGLIPRRIPLLICVGPVIPVEKTEDPTKEQIDKIHRQYVDSLKKLFDDYKGDYADMGAGEHWRYKSLLTENENNALSKVSVAEGRRMSQEKMKKVE